MIRQYQSISQTALVFCFPLSTTSHRVLFPVGPFGDEKTTKNGQAGKSRRHVFLIRNARHVRRGSAEFPEWRLPADHRPRSFRPARAPEKSGGIGGTVGIHASQHTVVHVAHNASLKAARQCFFLCLYNALPTSCAQDARSANRTSVDAAAHQSALYVDPRFGSFATTVPNGRQTQAGKRNGALEAENAQGHEQMMYHPPRLGRSDLEKVNASRRQSAMVSVTWTVPVLV